MPAVAEDSSVKARSATCATGLEQALRDNNTAILGDTLHFETLGVYDFHGTTLNPTDIVESLTSPDVYYHVWAAVKQTIEQRSISSMEVPLAGLVAAAMEQFIFELGNIILYRVAGPHFTFVDPRQHNNTAAMIINARRLVSLFEKRGIGRSNVVVSIPATQEGLAAAQELERTYRIRTNLYLVSGLMHAAACAEAGTTTITIPVGRLLDWHERKRKAVYKDMNTHPGIEMIQSTLTYFKIHNIKAKLIGSGFRALSEIGILGDFDAICVSKYQTERLCGSKVPISAPPTSSPASLRARQAQYPTALLSSKSGFMTGLSAGTRSMVAATLFVTLGEMKARMDSIEEIVGKEVSRQYELHATDLKALYRFKLATHKTRKSRRKSGDLLVERQHPTREVLDEAFEI